MFAKKVFFFFFCVLMLGACPMSVKAQQKQKFDIVKFELNQLDGTASNAQYKKIDGSGNLYAIIKVRATGEDTRGLNEFLFNFNSLKSIVEDKGDELWVYVQKNAKMVNISREGYAPVRNFDLKMTLQAGKTYNMEIATYGRMDPSVISKLNVQMLQFRVTPATSGLVVMYRQEGAGEYELFGQTGNDGVVGKNLSFGTYEYKVMSNSFFTSTGRVKLYDSEKVHVENVNLNGNLSEFYVLAPTGANIYIDNEFKGKGSWKGSLPNGSYILECRQEGFRTSTQQITVEPGAAKDYVVNLTPITGLISVASNPAGATVLIDGVEMGTTPCNIKNVLTGTRKLTVTKPGYNPTITEVYVEEGKMSKMNIVLDDVLQVSVGSNPSGAQLFIDGEYKQLTPFSANITPGNHLVELKHNGYKTYKENVLFDKNNPTHYAKLKNTMNNYYFQANCQYGLGGSLLPGASIGAYYKNFNAQLDCYFGEECVIGYSGSEYEHSVNYIGLRLGYGVKLASCVRLTPQLGGGYVNIGQGIWYHEGYESPCYCEGVEGVCGTLALRAEYGILPWLSVSLTPEYRIPISSNEDIWSDCFKEIVQDFRINLGVAFGF